MLHALVTAGPTIERMDPVRYISNFSSGKQGYAIANALKEQGINVTLVSGPVHLEEPQGMQVIHVESAINMHGACKELLETSTIDMAVCVAAVCDWRPQVYHRQKQKKQAHDEHATQTVTFVQNPDILHMISHHENRPKLVVGFAAETESMLDHAREKREKKGCDWIVANQVYVPRHHVEEGEFSVFNNEKNQLCLIKEDEVILFDLMDKYKAAKMLVAEMMGAGVK